jgi:hypothetical protein
MLFQQICAFDREARWICSMRRAKDAEKSLQGISLFEVALDPLIVNCDDIAQRPRCSLSHVCFLLAVLVAFSYLQFS